MDQCAEVWNVLMLLYRRRRRRWNIKQVSEWRSQTICQTVSYVSAFTCYSCFTQMKLNDASVHTALTSVANFQTLSHIPHSSLSLPWLLLAIYSVIIPLPLSIL